jgi:hypothetical protein
VFVSLDRNARPRSVTVADGGIQRSFSVADLNLHGSLESAPTKSAFSDELSEDTYSAMTHSGSDSENDPDMEAGREDPLADGGDGDGADDEGFRYDGDDADQRQ